MKYDSIIMKIILEDSQCFQTVVYIVACHAVHYKWSYLILCTGFRPNTVVKTVLSADCTCFLFLLPCVCLDGASV